MNRLSLDMLAPLMTELLQSGRDVHFQPEGESMLPLLPPGQCKVVLTQPNRPLKKYDILFYRRENGIFLLHRIVAVQKDGYTMCGDNQYVLEADLKPQNIIGLMKGFYRNGAYNGLNTVGYYIYCRTLWARRLCLRLRTQLSARLTRKTKK